MVWLQTTNTIYGMAYYYANLYHPNGNNYFSNQQGGCIECLWSVLSLVKANGLCCRQSVSYDHAKLTSH